MLEKTTNEVTTQGVIGQICVRNVPPRPTPPRPTPPLTQPPVPRPQKATGNNYPPQTYDVLTFQGFTPKTTIIKLAGGQCVRVTDYQVIQNTSEWIVAKLGVVPQREVVPLKKCPEGVEFT